MPTPPKSRSLDPRNEDAELAGEGTLVRQLVHLVAKEEELIEELLSAVESQNSKASLQAAHRLKALRTGAQKDA